jgi:hypothetical protein
MAMDSASTTAVRTWVEEHIADGRGFLVDLEGMTSEDDPLRDDTRSIRVHEGAHGRKMWSWKQGKIKMGEVKLSITARWTNHLDHCFPEVVCMAVSHR